MSIRLRLALWYGSLFGVIVVVVTLFSYNFQARGNYDDVDRALLSAAGHTALEVSTPAGASLLEGSNQFRVILRVYRPDGTLMQSSASSQFAPAVAPVAQLAKPSGPAFDGSVGLAPPISPLVVPAGSAFGLLFASGERWRVFVTPIWLAGSLQGYVEAVIPLGRIDMAMALFRFLLLGLSITSFAAALVGSWLLAGVALRPVAKVTASASAIAHNCDLSHRLISPRSQDEIGQLTHTFNEMLDSIEAAYQTQQRFVADASHELRAPLTVIAANLELLNYHPEMSPAEHDEALVEATRETARMSRLVANLLALARADAGVGIKHEAVDLDVIMLEVFRAARQLAHGQELVLDPLVPIRILGDADRIEQLLLILVDNALTYTSATGRVVIGLRTTDRQVEILVQDTGVGICAVDLPHVFERFYRADPARSPDSGGTGLGLAIGQWIAEQHGGQITLASQTGQGTTARIILPRLPNMVPSLSADSQETLSHLSAPKTMLYGRDD